MDKLKQTKNLFKKLIKDGKSIFYATDRIIRTLLNKARKLLYKKDTVFYRYYLDLDDKNVLYENENTKTRIPFYTPFVEQKKDIDRLSVLDSIKAPFELIHADVTDIRFFLALQLIQNISYWQWIFSPLNYLFIRWKAKIFYLENWNFFNEIFYQKENRLQKTKK